MATSLMGGCRSAVEIVHEILSLCANGGINKTAIMYRSNLSYDQLRKYLGMLSEEELIARDETGRFQITSGGQKTLNRMANAVKTLRELRRELATSQVAVST
jgi:predicted transcriptional regulator